MAINLLDNKIISKNLAYLLAVITIILLINFISQFAFYRFDLTADKRFTLSDDSKEILQDLDQELYIEVYLDGDLDVHFEKFKQSIEDLLYEFKIYGGSNFKYGFVNPFEDAKSDEKRDTIIGELIADGLKPRNVKSKDKEGGMSEKIIFPGAIVSYGKLAKAVNFLVDDPQNSGIDDIDYSANILEYNLIKAIKAVKTNKITQIAFLQGHSELKPENLYHVITSLAENYLLDSVSLNGQIDALDAYKVCIIAQPEEAFSPQDKYILDQYLMKGGHLLWFIDAIKADPESLRFGSIEPKPLNLQLDDFFLVNGIKLNKQLVRDLNCIEINYNVSPPGVQPDFRNFPVTYFPLLIPNPEHRITNNLNDITGKFTQTISWQENQGDLKYTPLIFTSDKTQLVDPPKALDMREMLSPTPLTEFRQSYLVSGLLVEGEFRSIANINRAATSMFGYTVPESILKSIDTKMVIIADGDIIQNQVSVDERGQLHIGNIEAPNLKLITNIVEYLAADTELIELRNRRFEIRRLDAAKIEDEETFWKILNMVIPSMIVIIFGGLFLYLRKRRFSKQAG